TGRLDSRGHRTRIRTVRRRLRRRQHFRRTRQPRRHLRRIRRRTHHVRPKHRLLDRPAARLRRRLLAPQVLHRRTGIGKIRIRIFFSGSGRVERCRFRDRDDVRAGVHGLRHGRGPEEGRPGDDRAHRHWFHRGCQHPGRRSLRRCVDEPGGVVWACRRELDLEQPLGVLARPIRWRRDRRAGVRDFLHGPVHT
ncbi:unnamed protein product, partial [Linum tenue]